MFTPRLLLIACSFALTATLHAAPAKLKALIVDGQNNHGWATTTPLLKRILEDTGRFGVEVSTSPAAAPAAPRLPKDATPAQKTAHAEALQKHTAQLAAHQAAAPALWAKWRPNFSSYAVVVSNYNGERWPTEVDAAFLSFVRNGGGFGSYHAANNSFADWPESNSMIGPGLLSR